MKLFASISTVNSPGCGFVKGLGMLGSTFGFDLFVTGLSTFCLGLIRPGSKK